MRHEFMQDMSDRLLAAGIATLRYEFPYMARGGGRPDDEATSTAAVHAAIKAAAELLPGVPLLAGGKSFGGRMTSHLLARGGEPTVRGLVFFGFPLHPAGAPAVKRAAHLARVKVPMLFLQGTRDALAELALVTNVTEGLGNMAMLRVMDGADHSFAVLKRSGRTAGDVRDELVRHVAAFADAHAT
jgi:predicted alpha/beta-hydrolase family hydrolase